MTLSSPVRPEQAKPLLRGWSHLVAFFAAAAGAITLVVTAPADRTRGASIYAATVLTLFGVSALYHRVTWKPRARRLMHRLDHSAIFLLIAGTGTPFGLALPTRAGTVMIAILWAGAGMGTLRELVWAAAPKPVAALSYVALGWTVAWFIPEMNQTFGREVLAWIVAGGLLYTVGAVVYAARWPNPWPTVFGFHEIFHVFVIAAAVCHFVAVNAVLSLR